MKQPLLAFYGDDFTGSADCMEVLQWAGLRTALFLEPPTPQQLLAFADLKAFGVAGWSRSMSPAEMEAELMPVLLRLRDSGAAIVHYKTCSTFDSSPTIGSIGKALELGRRVFGETVIPMVIGAPGLGRYQVFGNLFARSGLDSQPYRLDRHPTMRQHPITPMAEADLRLHLAEQTRLEVCLVDVLELENAIEPDRLEALAREWDVLLFDVLYERHLRSIGEAMQILADRASPSFVAGSSGVEYALCKFWSETGRIPPGVEPETRPKIAATDQLLVITGSCSPVNDRQIASAESSGFEAMPLDPARLVNPQTTQQEIESSVARAVKLLRAGKNVILHSSRGPSDQRIQETIAALRALGLSDLDIKLHSGRILGPKLGKIMAGILHQYPLRRLAVAGGDTSGYIARELGITALEAIAPVAPGSPLCRAYADNALDGIECFFKGGQVGKDDVWRLLVVGG